MNPILSDVSFSTESLVVVSALVSALAGAVAYVFKLLMASKEKQISDMTSARDSYKEIALESLTKIEEVVNRVNHGEGKPAFIPLVPVIAEHSSPTLEAQKQAAELQTMRARLVSATLNLSLPPREASRPATPAEEEAKKP